MYISDKLVNLTVKAAGNARIIQNCHGCFTIKFRHQVASIGTYIILKSSYLYHICKVNGSTSIIPVFLKFGVSENTEIVNVRIFYLEIVSL